MTNVTEMIKCNEIVLRNKIASHFEHTGCHHIGIRHCFKLLFSIV